ncbi:MAG: hypothetical protein IKU26_08935 [Clostridia bacterium]|nr:hypothetical protein [Clostridia bacterium]
MSDRKTPNQEERKLVRVNGRERQRRVYDNYGYEIEGKRVHPSHTEEVRKRLEEEKTMPKGKDPLDDSHIYGETPIRDSFVKEDKLRSFQNYQNRRKKEKKDAMFTAMRVGIFLVCIGVLVLVVFLSGKVGNQVNTQYVQKGSIDNAVKGDIAFLRNEIPVEVGQNGTFVPYVKEGDRISKDALVGYVIQAGYEVQLAQLRTVENKLIAAQQAMSYVNSAKTPELLVVEEAIEQVLVQLSEMSIQGDLSDYMTCAKELRTLYQEKNELLMNMETTDSYLSELQQQRNQILAQIETSMFPVVAPESGIVSFCIDAQETVVSAACSALQSQVAQTDFTTPSSCRVQDAVLDLFAVPAGKLSTMSDATVRSGNIVARITPDVSYYATMEIASAEGLQIVPGRTAIIRTDTGTLSFEAEVCGVYKSDSRLLLVLSCKKALMATVSERHIQGEVVFAHTEGIKVPLRALAEWDEAGVTARLTVVRAGYVEYVYVNILAKDHDYAVINSKATMDNQGISVRVNDIYVVEYEKVQEGQAL